MRESAVPLEVEVLPRRKGQPRPLGEAYWDEDDLFIYFQRDYEPGEGIGLNGEATIAIDVATDGRIAHFDVVLAEWQVSAGLSPPRPSMRGDLVVKGFTREFVDVKCVTNAARSLACIGIDQGQTAVTVDVAKYLIAEVGEANSLLRLWVLRIEEGVPAWLDEKIRQGWGCRNG